MTTTAITRTGTSSVGIRRSATEIALTPRSAALLDAIPRRSSAGRLVRRIATHVSGYQGVATVSITGFVSVMFIALGVASTLSLGTAGLAIGAALALTNVLFAGWSVDREEGKKTLAGAEKDVDTLLRGTGTMLLPSDAKRLRTIRNLPRNAPGRSEALLRTAAIATEHQRPDKPMQTERAREAIGSVLDRVEAIQPPTFEGRGLATLVGAAPTALGRPVAHPLIEIGEAALAIDPDLVDGGGARVDALVRRHVPALIEARDRAAAALDGEDLERAEADFQRGIRIAEASVREAMTAAGGRRAEELASLTRFLDMRHRSVL